MDSFRWRSTFNTLLILLYLAISSTLITGCAIERTASVSASTEELLEEAFTALKNKNYGTSLSIFKPLANSGNTTAQVGVGVTYAAMLNHQEAVIWYRKAADQGEPAAQYLLALMYDKGVGIPQNYKEAVRWYSKAAKQGDKDAIKALSEISEPSIQKMHDIFDAVIPNINKELAGKKLDKFTTVKSIIYDRYGPTITYKYKKNDELINLLSTIGWTDEIPKHAKKSMIDYHVDKVCSSPLLVFIRSFGLNVVHDFDEVIRINITASSCEGYHIKNATIKNNLGNF